jgi:hypothetical protein
MGGKKTVTSGGMTWGMKCTHEDEGKMQCYRKAGDLDCRYGMSTSQESGMGLAL